MGGVTAPITTPTGTVIARVAERADVTDPQIAEGRDALREELVNQRRDRFFTAYMAKAKTSLQDRHQAGRADAGDGPDAGAAGVPRAGARRAVSQPQQDGGRQRRHRRHGWRRPASAASMADDSSFHAASICGVGGRSAPSTSPSSCVA